ncbi:MAG: hypothetical protein RIE73_28910 [Coleofasciculus sp. C1-SOL-03]
MTSTCQFHQLRLYTSVEDSCSMDAITLRYIPGNDESPPNREKEYLSLP